MVLKGTYKLSYTIDKEPNDLIVSVELKMIEGFNMPRKNIWEGQVIVNDVQYTEDLSHCVNALLAAERIGLKQKEILKENCKLNKITFKLKKEIIK